MRARTAPPSFASSRRNNHANTSRLLAGRLLWGFKPGQHGGSFGNSLIWWNLPRSCWIGRHFNSMFRFYCFSGSFQRRQNTLDTPDCLNFMQMMSGQCLSKCNAALPECIAHLLRRTKTTGPVDTKSLNVSSWWMVTDRLFVRSSDSCFALVNLCFFPFAPRMDGLVCTTDLETALKTLRPSNIDKKNTCMNLSLYKHSPALRVVFVIETNSIQC